VENGVIVSDVKPYGEAFNRSISTGSIIMEVDKKPVTSPKEFKSLVDSHKPGDAVLMRVKTPTNDIAFLALQIPK